MTVLNETAVHCSHDAMVDTFSLIPNPRNPNTHPDTQIKLLAKIIREQGWRAPITVSNRSGFIVRGHGRLMAAKELGLNQVPVDYQDYESEASEWADLIADNRLSELSEIDDNILTELLEELKDDGFDLDLAGYDETDLDELLDSMKDEESPEDDGFDEEGETEVFVKQGDVWQLGEHRLMCGDSTSIEDVKKLMDGNLADLLLTDPPYNVAYEGGTKDSLTIQNDDMGDEEFREFLVSAFRAADSVLRPGAGIYIWHADSEGFNFRGACRDVGWPVRQCLIWNKNSMVLGRQDYNWKHEPCLYMWKPGAAHYFTEERTHTTVLDFDKPQRNGEHPTMKPVELFAYQIDNSTRKRQRVLDLFGGSGTTMVASEQLNRISYLMELDERYASVIVRRYISLMGSSAGVYLIDADGERVPYAQVLNERIPEDVDVEPEWL